MLKEYYQSHPRAEKKSWKIASLSLYDWPTSNDVYFFQSPKVLRNCRLHPTLGTRKQLCLHLPIAPLSHPGQQSVYTRTVLNFSGIETSRGNEKITTVMTIEHSPELLRFRSWKIKAKSWTMRGRTKKKNLWNIASLCWTGCSQQFDCVYMNGIISDNKMRLWPNAGNDEAG